MNDLALLRVHLDTLYRYDARGRIVSLHEPAEGLAPRFHLCRSRLGNLWRMRRDLISERVRRLATLAAREGPIDAEANAPERVEFIRRALESDAPIVDHGAGPAFVLPEVLPPLAAPGARLERLGAGDAARLHPALASHADWLEACAPSIGAIDGDVIVAICRVARGDSARAAEASLETTSEARGRGFGSAVARVWAEAIRQRGGLALYSTAWGNAASRAVARKLAAIQYGEDWSWR